MNYERQHGSDSLLIYLIAGPGAGGPGEAVFGAMMPADAIKVTRSVSRRPSRPMFV